MPSYNKVLLMGNLTRDIELRHTSANTAVANIGLAVNRRFKGQDGQQRDETTFVDCEAWGRTAEVMSQYLSKGRPVFIEGRLRLDQWQDQQGNNRSKLMVVVENFQFIDSRADAPNARSVQTDSQRAPDAAHRDEAPGAPSVHTRSTQPEAASIEEDDIPF